MALAKRSLAALFLTSTLLAGCKGADVSGESSGGSSSSSGSAGGNTPVELPFTDSEILLASFIESLDTVRTQANRLLTRDRRYTVQTAPSDRYVDKNGNNRFDSGVDVELQGNPIEHAGIHYAHAAGLTGEGEVIAFSDSGFRTSHEAFSGKSITTGSGLAQTNHGTFVASIATGNSDDMIGVAPGADVIFGSFDSLAQLAETASDARAAGAVALNNSWGFGGLTANTASYNSVFGSSDGSAYLNALTDYARDGVVVFSVPNDSGLSSTGLMAALPAFEPSLEQSWLAVVNGVPVMSGDDVVSAERVSEPCLEAAEWCISANGSWTGAIASSNTSYSFGTGTSYAAPSVSGALALLAEAFPDMSHQQLRIRLLASADNDFTGFTQSGTTELAPGFEHAYSDEWGHGFLDVAAALLPIGQATVTTGSGAVISMNEPLVVTGGASGDAVTRALQNVQIHSRDALAATFSVNAADMVAQRRASPMFTLADVTDLRRLRPSEFGGSAFFGERQSILSPFAGEDMEFALFHGQNGSNDRLGFGVSRGFDLGGANLKISTAYGADTATLLSEWNGDTNAAITAFDMELSTRLSDASQLVFALGYALGQQGSTLGQSADVLMNASAVSYAHSHLFAHDDRFNLSLSLPAAITSGATSLSLPVASPSGATTYEDVRINLAPTSREVRLALTYDRPLGRRSRIGISLAHAENRGHIAGLQDTAIMVGWNMRF